MRDLPTAPDEVVTESHVAIEGKHPLSDLSAQAPVAAAACRRAVVANAIVRGLAAMRDVWIARSGAGAPALVVRACRLILLVLILVSAGSPRARAAGLGIVGTGAPSRQVILAVQADGTLTGTLDVPLNNTSPKRVRITARFFSETSSQPLTIGPNTRPLAVAHPLTLASGGQAVLVLLANLSSKEPVSNLGGTLVVQARVANHVVSSLELRLAGSLAIPTDVAFEPSDVTLQVTRGQLFYKTAGDHQTVRLRGIGVASLIATIGKLASAKKAQPFATLLVSDDAGQETLVELLDLHQVGPVLAEVTVATRKAVTCINGTVECGGGAPSAGSYTGTLTLTPGTSGGPALKVTVHSRWWFAIPVLLLLGGAFIGGLLPLLTANARTKNELRDTLRRALDAYKKMAPTDAKKHTAWDIESLLGPEPWYPKRYTALPGAKGVAPLWSNIASARNDDDLKEDGAQVRELTAQLNSWMEAEPLASELASLLDNPPGDRQGHAWRDTQVRKDSASLLREMHNAFPPSAATAHKYTERLQRQLRFHRDYAEAWERRRALEELPFSENQKQRDHAMWGRANLDQLNEKVKATPAATRSSTAQAQLEGELADIADAIERLIASHEQGVDADKAVIPLIDAKKREAVVQLVEEEKSPGEVAEALAVPVSDIHRLQTQLLRMEVTPPSSTEPSTLPLRARTSQLPARENGEQSSPNKVSAFLRHLMYATDLTLSILIAVVTAVAYMLPLYTSTWGSWQDWAAAFAAGVVGQIGIKWALLPSLRSKRLPMPASPI
jgi:hypothetical protein